MAADNERVEISKEPKTVATVVREFLKIHEDEISELGGGDSLAFIDLIRNIINSDFSEEHIQNALQYGNPKVRKLAEKFLQEVAGIKNIKQAPEQFVPTVETVYSFAGVSPENDTARSIQKNIDLLRYLAEHTHFNKDHLATYLWMCEQFGMEIPRKAELLESGTTMTREQSTQVRLALAIVHEEELTGCIQRLKSAPPSMETVKMIEFIIKNDDALKKEFEQPADQTQIPVKPVPTPAAAPQSTPKLMSQNPDEVDELFNQQIKDWGEKITSIQAAVTKRTNLSILVGIPLAILLVVLITVGIDKFLPSNATGLISLCIYPVAIGLTILANNFWGKRFKVQAVQQIAEEILQTSESKGISKSKVIEALDARLPYSSVCNAVMAKVDPEKAAMIKQEKTKAASKSKYAKSRVDNVHMDHLTSASQPASPSLQSASVTNEPVVRVIQPKESGENSIMTPSGRPCAVCNADQWGGITYPVYFGTAIGTSTDRPDANHIRTTYKFKINGMEYVFVCYHCLLTPAIKLAKFGYVTFVIFTVLTFWTILGGIIGVAGANYFNNMGEKLKKVLSGVDKEMQESYINKEKNNLDGLGFNLAKKAQLAVMKSSGDKFGVCFTPAEYATLKTDK